MDMEGKVKRKRSVRKGTRGENVHSQIFLKLHVGLGTRCWLRDLELWSLNYALTFHMTLLIEDIEFDCHAVINYGAFRVWALFCYIDLWPFNCASVKTGCSSVYAHFIILSSEALLFDFLTSKWLQSSYIYSSKHARQIWTFYSLSG